MSTVKSKNLQVGTDATASNNFTIYQPSTPDGTLRIGVGNADSPTEVGRFTSVGYKPATAPAFSAYNAGQQPISASTDTKVAFNYEEFDTNSNYDHTTNFRFTPTVAGYYQFNTNVYHGGAAYSYITLVFYKNGSALLEVDRISYTGQAETKGSGLIYLNGSTDYVEVYARSQGAAITLGANDKRFMNFSGFLAQQA